MRANIEWANDGENGARAGKKIEGQRGSRGAMNVNVGPTSIQTSRIHTAHSLPTHKSQPAH